MSIKVCPKVGCGKPVEDGTGKYCPHCGYVIIEILTAAETEVAQQRLAQAGSLILFAAPKLSKAEEPAPVKLEPVPVVEEVVPPEPASKRVITEVIDVVPPQPKVEPAPLANAEKPAETRKVEVENLFGDVKVERLSPTAERLATAAGDRRPNTDVTALPPKVVRDPVAEAPRPSPVRQSVDPNRFMRRTKRGVSNWLWAILVLALIGLVVALLVTSDWTEQTPVAVVEEVAPAAPNTDGGDAPVLAAGTVTAEDPEARKMARKAIDAADKLTTGLGKHETRLQGLENEERGGQLIIGGLEAAPPKACEFHLCVAQLLAEGDQRLVQNGIISQDEARASAERTCRATGCGN